MKGMAVRDEVGNFKLTSGYWCGCGPAAKPGTGISSHNPGASRLEPTTSARIMFMVSRWNVEVY